MTTLIVVPVLGRPHSVQPLVDSIEAGTPEPHRTLFVGSESDTAQLDAVRAAGADLLVVPDERGSYACKINDAYRSSDEPLLFMAADDLRFHPGWLTAASRLLDRAEVVGTDDGGGNPRVGRGEHSCHSLFTRRYIADQSGVFDQPDLVLHEGYGHAYCDDEFLFTANQRSVYTHCTEAVVEHMHPFFGKGRMDATYRLGQTHNRTGRGIWQERRMRIKQEVRCTSPS